MRKNGTCVHFLSGFLFRAYTQKSGFVTPNVTPNQKRHEKRGHRAPSSAFLEITPEIASNGVILSSYPLSRPPPDISSDCLIMAFFVHTVPFPASPACSR